MALGLALVAIGIVLVIVTFMIIKRTIDAGDQASIRSQGASGLPQRVRRASLLMLIGLVAIIAGIVVAIVA